MSAATVREAVPGDAPRIAEVHVAVWHEAYTGRMPQSILDGMTVESRRALWDRVLTERRGALWVAEADGLIVGFASAGASLDDPPAAPTQLYAINVLASHHGTGAGEALLRAAIGEGPASLWVLADNPRARAFYAKHGFTPDGAVKDDDAWGEAIREVRLVRG